MTMAPNKIGMNELLESEVSEGASDLHLTVGLPPVIRVDGALANMSYQPLAPIDAQRLIYDILTNDQVQLFEATRELDFSYGVKAVGRFRAAAWSRGACW